MFSCCLLNACMLAQMSMAKDGPIGVCIYFLSTAVLLFFLSMDYDNVFCLKTSYQVL